MEEIALLLEFALVHLDILERHVKLRIVTLRVKTVENALESTFAIALNCIPETGAKM